MIKEKIGIHKKYLIVNAPVPFKLIANNGTDFVERPSGIWQLDCYKLLPEKFMKNYPVFDLVLEYDETKIEDGFSFTYYLTNLNLGDSLKGVSGDLVELSEYQFLTLKKLLTPSERVELDSVGLKYFYEIYSTEDLSVRDVNLYNDVFISEPSLLCIKQDYEDGSYLISPLLYFKVDKLSLFDFHKSILRFSAFSVSFVVNKNSNFTIYQENMGFQNSFIGTFNNLVYDSEDDSSFRVTQTNRIFKNTS